MTTENAPTASTETSAAVAEQGATVAPEKASSKKTASPNKGATKSQKSAKGRKPKAPTSAKPQKTTPARKATKALKKATKAKAEGVRPGSKTAAVLALLRRPKGCYPHRDHASHILAAPQRPRVHQRHPGEEDAAYRDFHQARRWRPRSRHRPRGGF